MPKGTTSRPANRAIKKLWNSTINKTYQNLNAAAGFKPQLYKGSGYLGMPRLDINQGSRQAAAAADRDAATELRSRRSYGVKRGK